MYEYQDETLTCRDCGKEFVFSASEQAYFAERGFQNKPTRCLECRRLRRANNPNGAQSGRPLFKFTCANCGKEDTVNFEPRGDKPLYCRECYRELNNARRDSYQA